MDRCPLPTPIETTPRPERPALSQAEQPGSGTATDRLLTAAGGLLFAALILRAFIPS